MELMLCTDLRLLAAEARIGLPEIRLGLFPGGGGSQRLMRQIPLCHAKNLMFTGQHLEASQALALGLVNEVLPRADLMPRAMALAGQVAAMSPQTLKLLKHAMLHGAEMPLEQASAYERAMLAVVLDHPDAKEGCQAFLDKRSPRFSGSCVEHRAAARPSTLRNLCVKVELGAPMAGIASVHSCPRMSLVWDCLRAFHWWSPRATPFERLTSFRQSCAPILLSVPSP